MLIQRKIRFNEFFACTQLKININKQHKGQKYDEVKLKSLTYQQYHLYYKEMEIKPVMFKAKPIFNFFVQ